MYDFGLRLRELREEKDLSQMQFSKFSGLSQSAIARYELNKTEPRLSDIRIICNYFNVTADYLIGLSEDY